MEGCIASPHWEACNTCLNLGNNGCKLSSISLEVHQLGDWIICEDYEMQPIVKADTKDPAVNCPYCHHVDRGEDTCVQCGRDLRTA